MLCGAPMKSKKALWGVSHWVRNSEAAVRVLGHVTSVALQPSAGASALQL